jgi:hypothetical protein
MAINFSDLRKPDNPLMVDPSTGRIREDWALYLDALTNRLNGVLGELNGASFADFVEGPASSTDSHLAAFDGTDGKTIKDSGISISDVLTETEAAAAYAVVGRQIISGAGLTGGGTLAADRTLAVGAGTGITVNADDVALDTASTRNTDHSGVTLTAGAGLTGGGDISASRSFAVGAGTGITANADDVAVTENVRTAAIVMVLDGNGAVIATGNKRGIRIPFACTITGWGIGLDQSGSIVIDIWKDTTANYPPVVGDTITASAKPTVTTATHNESTTLTGWTTSVTAGDWLYFNVDSVTSATYAALTLTVVKT